MAYPLSAGLTVRRRASRTGEAGIIRSAGNVPFPECHQLIEDSLFTIHMTTREQVMSTAAVRNRQPVFRA
jgi:hypothetical protein